MSIVLRRDQIEKLVSIYQHFHEIETFTISLEENSDMISVTFDLCDIAPPHKSKNNIDKSFKPQVYK